MKPLPRFLKETLRWLLLVGRIPMGRGFLRELRRTCKSLRAIWNPNAAARPPTMRRGLRTWLRRFYPPRRVTLTLLVPYLVGYVMLREMQLLSSHYPVEALDRYMDIRNANPTITTFDRATGYPEMNPVAEASRWGLSQMDYPGEAPCIRWAVALYWPALYLESRIHGNVDLDESPVSSGISGMLPVHRCREALLVKLMEKTGLDCAAALKDTSGHYSCHVADYKNIRLLGWLPAAVARKVVLLLNYNSFYAGGLAADYPGWNEEAEDDSGTQYFFWMPHDDPDSEWRLWESWRITLRKEGADLEYRRSYSDGWKSGAIRP